MRLQTRNVMAVRDTNRERGFALISVVLFLFLLSAVAVTLAYTSMTEKRMAGSDQEGNAAYYDAEAGMEKMTADLGALYLQNKAPKVSEITDLGNFPPPLVNVTYQPYTLTVDSNPDGTPKSRVQSISAGDFAGLSAQIIPISL